MSEVNSADYKSLYDKKSQDYDALQLRFTGLEQQLLQLKKMIFGSRQERFAPAQTSSAQLGLDMATQTLPEPVVVKQTQISYTKTQTAQPVSHPGRMKLPESLRRQEIIIEPTEDTTGCRPMPPEIIEVLEYEPGELFVKKYIRNKYSRPGREGVLIGELPARPIDKLLAGEGLLAQIIIDKYTDHLPLYRQMQRFERNSLKLPYSTLTNWVSSACTLIEPLYEALKKQVLQSGYLHADETPIKVMDKDKQGTTHRGFFWVYQNSRDKMVFFDYQPGRGREGPTGILKDFTGYLQSDGYAAYDIFEEMQGIVLLNCMAHARRLFTEALDNDQPRASYALGQMQQLYAIERSCAEEQLSIDQIKDRRHRQALPILQHLGQWMKDQYQQILPKSVIGKALAYSILRWDKLSLYTQDGQLKIDNNAVENSIRPVALGRKNYLFCGSHEAARRSAMLYSLLGTAKLHDIEPYHWLKTTLSKIAQHPINRIAELLPQKSP